MDYQKMWEDFKIYVEGIKSATQNMDTKGVNEAECYKKGLIFAYDDIEEKTKEFEERYLKK